MNVGDARDERRPAGDLAGIGGPWPDENAPVDGAHFGDTQARKRSPEIVDEDPREQGAMAELERDLVVVRDDDFPSGFHRASLAPPRSN